MPAKPYDQISPLARSLEHVGDRWTLLIVAALLVTPKRYTDLVNALPGIPSNLLRDRIKRLQADGIVTRFEAPPPVATSLYELTARGRELEPIVMSLIEWGHPLVEASDGRPLLADTVVLGLRAVLRRRTWTDRAVVAFEVGGDRLVTVEVVGDKVEPTSGRAQPDLIIAADEPSAIARLISGASHTSELIDGTTVRAEGDLALIAALDG